MELLLSIPGSAGGACLQDDEEFVAGEGVDELIELLESGRPMPPDPEYEGLQPETAAAFTARIDKLKAAYEAQFLDRKNWKVRSLATAMSHDNPV